MWFKNNIDRHEYPKQLQAHPAKKVKYPIPEIPDDSGKKSGTDWVLPKIIGSGRVSGTRLTLVSPHSRPAGGRWQDSPRCHSAFEKDKQ